jgi:DNA-binding beta-propeller fold protein YncE
MGHSMSRALRIIAIGLFCASMGAFVACGSGGAGAPSEIPSHFAGPTALVVTPNADDIRGVYLYVLNSQGDTISVIDAKFRTLISGHAEDETRNDVIFVGPSPYDLGIAPNGNYLFVTDANDGNLRRVEAHPPYRVVETGTIARAGHLAVPVQDAEIATPVGYLTVPDESALLRLDLNTGEVLERIDLPGTPVAITITPDGKLLGVTTEDSEILLIEIDSAMVTTDALHLGGRPGNLTSDADGDLMFVLNNDPPRVHLIDLDYREQLEEEVTFESPLTDLTLTPDGRFIYISSPIGRVYAMSTTTLRPCGASFGRIFFADEWPESNVELTDLEVFDCVTADERWTVVYEDSTQDWIVEGTTSGRQAAHARTDQFFLADSGQLGFTIREGDRHPSDGDLFYFETRAGVEPIRVGLVPEGLVATPYWKNPEFALIYVANTGSHSVSILYEEDQVHLGALN